MQLSIPQRYSRVNSSSASSILLSCLNLENVQPQFPTSTFLFFLFSTQLNVTAYFLCVGFWPTVSSSTGREVSDTHSLQSPYFSTASRLRNKWWKKKCCELWNLQLTKHPSSSLLRFLRRVSVYRIFCGNCFLPDYVTNSIWTKFDAAFRSIPLTFVARGVYPVKTRGLPVTEVKCYFSVITLVLPDTGREYTCFFRVNL